MWNYNVKHYKILIGIPAANVEHWVGEVETGFDVGEILDFYPCVIQRYAKVEARG